MVSNLRQAWRQAEAGIERNLERTASGLPEENLDDPLRDEDQQSLLRELRQEYKYMTPAAWMGTDSM